MGLKLGLMACVVVACGLPFYAMLKALRADHTMLRESWARSSPRARRIQMVAVAAWFATLVVAFAISYAVTNRALASVGIAVGLAALMAVLGPLIALRIGTQAHTTRSKQGSTGTR